MMSDNPKLSQFNDELDALCKKYQYILYPALEYNDSGVLPRIKVRDEVPEKSDVVVEETPATTPEAPVVEPITPEEAPASAEAPTA